MMKNKKNFSNKILMFLVLLGVGVSLRTVSVFGMENAVQTNGEITFYEESTDSTTTSSTKDSSETKPTNSKQPPTSGSVDTPTKPVGRFPTTGELVKKSLSISGLLMVALILIFYWLKRKKKDDKKEEEVNE